MNVKPNQAFQAFEPENDVKAFIYQQVQVLEGLTKDLGSLAVLIEKEEFVRREAESSETTADGEKYAVTFVVAPESFNLQIRAESKDIYEAARVGREEAQRRISALINFMGEGEAPPSGYKGWLH